MSLNKIIEAEKEIDSDFSIKTNKKKEKKDDDNIIYTSYFETKDYILEQILNTEDTEGSEQRTGGQKTCFIKYSKLKGEIEKINEIEHEGKLFRPIVDDVFMKGGVRLPTGVSDYKNTKEITDQVRQFLKENIEVPVFYERFLPNLLLFYWVYEKFPFIPYLGFVGGTGTGKTTAMVDFGSLSYKPIDTTGSLTIASLFRIATAWRGTLLIDEFYKVGEHSKEIIAFLKAGVSDRLILRVEGENRKSVNAYVVKSPKLFTSEQAVSDAGLNSRTLFVNMQKAKKRVPLFKLQDYYEEANEIRNKLLLWRLRNLNKIDLKKIKYGYDEFREFDGRVQQILTGIYYLSDDKTKKSILEFAIKQEEDTKRERKESISGMVFEIMCEFWDKDADVELKVVTSMLNERRKGSGYKTEFTERKIGSVIRRELGFETERGGQGGNTFIIRNAEIEENKRNYFGIDLGTNKKVGPSVIHSDYSVHSDGDAENTLEEEKEMEELNKLF